MFSVVDEPHAQYYEMILEDWTSINGRTLVLHFSCQDNTKIKAAHNLDTMSCDESADFAIKVVIHHPHHIAC